MAAQILMVADDIAIPAIKGWGDAIFVPGEDKAPFQVSFDPLPHDNARGIMRIARAAMSYKHRADKKWAREKIIAVDEVEIKMPFLAEDFSVLQAIYQNTTRRHDRYFLCLSLNDPGIRELRAQLARREEPQRQAPAVRSIAPSEQKFG